MPKPASHLTYTDVIPLWHAAIQNGGLIAQATDLGAARRMAQRLNGYRAALRAYETSALGIPGLVAETPHDRFEVKVDTKNFRVKIAPRLLASFTLTDLDGAPVSLDPDTPPPPSDFTL